MGDLTDNLSRHEFACRCGCGLDTVDFELITILQEVVDHFTIALAEAITIDIPGGNRCVTHDAVVQLKYNSNWKPGDKPSEHTVCKASDFKLFRKASKFQVPPNVVADYLELKYPTKYGIGRYHNRTHFDSRSTRSRWDKT